MVYVILVVFILTYGIGTGKKIKHKYETNYRWLNDFNLLLITILPESAASLVCMINDEFTASSMLPVHVYSPASDSLRSEKL